MNREQVSDTVSEMEIGLLVHVPRDIPDRVLVQVAYAHRLPVSQLGDARAIARFKLRPNDGAGVERQVAEPVAVGLQRLDAQSPSVARCSAQGQPRSP
jgi:hypothetical protein